MNVLNANVRSGEMERNKTSQSNFSPTHDKGQSLRRTQGK